MDVLARRDPPRGDGRVIYVPRDAGRICDRTKRRNALIAARRRVFLRLIVATAVTAPPALFFGGRWWIGFLACATVLGVYITLLRRWKAEADLAAAVVRQLPDVERAREVSTEPREVVAVGGDTLYGLPVANRPDEPWAPQSMVRIRRWDA